MDSLETVQVKFTPKTVNARLGCVMIVGQNPGNQRPGQRTNIVWEGNKSADLLLKAIDGIDNLFITNICNYQDPLDRSRISEGLDDLRKAVEVYQPERIVCIGARAHLAVMATVPQIHIRKLTHPSYVIRFGKDQQRWIDRLRRAIQE